MKRNKDEEEQCLAVKCLLLAVIRMGSTEISSKMFCALCPQLHTKVMNPVSFPGTRSTCAEALALACFVIKDKVLTTEVLHALEKIVHSEDKLSNSQVLKSALSACSLLLTLAPADVIYQFKVDNYDILMEFLKGCEKQLSLTAGEIHALICELLEDCEGPYSLEYSQEVDLKDELYKMVHETAKSKTSRKRHSYSDKQHIRDILATVEGRDRSVRIIKFSMEHKLFSLGLCDWKQHIRYCAYARVLGSSFTKHLATNTEMRNMLSYNEEMIRQVSKKSKHTKTKHNH